MTEADKTVELFQELVKWTKVTSISQVRKLLLELLTTPEEKNAYQISDGEKTSREIAKLSNLGKTKVQTMWKAWINAGIADPISVKGGVRAKKNFSLDEFGIEIPAIKVKKSRDKIRR